jgi:amino acid transporter
MTDFTNEQEQERLQSYINIHLKKEKQSLPLEEQIEELRKRNRRKWIMLAVNIAAILIFGYSFYYDITQLSQTFFIVIVAVFGINVGLIFYQHKQINELIDYLTWKQQ